MSYAKDPRVVLTLDAGGTNFVFSAVQSDREVVEPLTLPSNAHELQACLGTIVEGFSKVKEKAPAAPSACLSTSIHRSTPYACTSRA